VVFGLCVAACRPPQTQVIVVEPLVATPALVPLEGWVGFDMPAVVVVSNPNQVEAEESIEASTPELVAPPTVRRGPAESAELAVTFRPVAPGRSLAELRFTGGTVVTFELSARRPPLCAPVEVCHRSEFDPLTGACVDSVAMNGAACSSPFACFASASCVDGQCVGRYTVCDDADRCTLDVCGALGCGALDATGGCPTSTNPCERPACHRETGCHIEDVEDGTPCGARTCDEARVCINGQCVTRAAPKTQACVDVWLGHPAGPGLNDGVGEAARFQGVTSMWWQRGGPLLFVSDGDLIRSISPNGRVETIAGGAATPRLGFGPAAGFAGPRIIGETAGGELVVWDQGNEQHAEALRLVSARGVVSGFVGGGLRSACPPSGTGIGAAACPGALQDGGTPRATWQVVDWLADPAQAKSWLRFSRAVPRESPPTMQRVSALGEVTSTVLADDTYCDVRCLEPAFVVCTNGVVVGSAPAQCARAAFKWHPGGRRQLDGGSEAVAVLGPATDGPLGAAGLAPSQFLIAAEHQGRLAVFDSTRNHVRVIANGAIRTLSGPQPREGLVDGPRRQALVAGWVESMAWSGGHLWFLDSHYPDGGVLISALRRADSVVVTRLIEPRWNSVVIPRSDGVSLVVRSWSSSMRHFLDGGTAPEFISGFPLEVPGGVMWVDSNWVQDDRDGFDERLPSRVCAAGVVDGGVLVLEGAIGGSAERVSALERDGGVWVQRELWNFRSMGAQIKCHQSAVAFSSSGTLYNVSGRSLRLVRLNTGAVVELATLFDEGFSVAVDDQERVYVGTTGAILQLAP
jgi:hypothetical protein